MVSALGMILKAESPFFIKDVVEKYPKLKAKSIYVYIRWHSDRFRAEKVRNGKRGRPQYLYYYVPKEEQ